MIGQRSTKVVHDKQLTGTSLFSFGTRAEHQQITNIIAIQNDEKVCLPLSAQYNHIKNFLHALPPMNGEINMSGKDT